MEGRDFDLIENGFVYEHLWELFYPEDDDTISNSLRLEYYQEGVALYNRLKNRNDNCRRAAGAAMYCLAKLLPHDLAKMIGQHIWSTQGWREWDTKGRYLM